jgi:hypothetical protein
MKLRLQVAALVVVAVVGFGFMFVVFWGSHG